MFGKWFRDNADQVGQNQVPFPWIVFTPALYFSSVVVLLHVLDRLSISLTPLTAGLVHAGLIAGFVLFLTGFFKRTGMVGLGTVLFGLRPAYSLLQIGYLFVPVVAGLIFWWMTYHGLYKPSITPPHNHDAANHIFMVRRIMEAGTIDYSTVFYYSPLNSWYPMGMHVFIASVLHILGNTTLLQGVYPLVLILGSFFPWAIFLLANAVGLSRRLAAGASFLSLTLFLFPFNVLSWGGFGMLVGLVLLTFLLALSIYFFRQPTREKFIGIWLLGLTLFLTHTSEVFSYLVFLVPTLLVFRPPMTSLKPFWKSGAVLVALSIFLILPFLSQALGRTELTHLIRTQPHYPLGAIWTYIYFYFLNVNVNYVFTSLALLGVMWSFKKPGVKAIGILFLVILGIWVTRFVSPVLDGLFLKTYPWLEYERIAYLFALPYPLAASLGVNGLIDTILRLGRKKESRTLVYVVYALVILGFSGPILAHSYKNLAEFIRNYSATTSEDIRLIRSTANECKIYLTEVQDDAGRWIPYVTGNKVLFDGNPELYADLEQRVELVEGVQLEAEDAKVSALTAQFPFDCIFFGNKRVQRNNARLSLPKLFSNPNLSVVASEGLGYVFRLADADKVEEEIKIQPRDILVSEDELFKHYVEGGVGAIKKDQVGSSYRLVSTVMDVWFKEPYENILITAQTVQPSEVPCDVYVNGDLESSILITQNLQEIELARLEKSTRQKQVRIVCPAKDERALRAIEEIEDSRKLELIGAHFAITKLHFK